jgi:hypothetical protein
MPKLRNFRLKKNEFSDSVQKSKLMIPLVLHPYLVKLLDVEVHDCNPSTYKAEARGSSLRLAWTKHQDPVSGKKKKEF